MESTTLKRAAEVTRRRLLGIAFLLVVATLLSLSVMQYKKVFTPIVPVKLQAERAGAQMNPGADVKLRGIIVGEVRNIALDQQTGSAVLDLALDPKSVGMIPANIEARLLPKTLFGEKYVDLVIPKVASPHTIHTGDTIPLDRSKAAIELERVLDNLMPLLRTLDPQQLSGMLTALATALEGRGERLGTNLVTLEGYLAKLEPALPTLREDLRQLATVADTYADVAPDLLTMLRNLTVTNDTISDQKRELESFFSSTTAFAGTTDDFLVRHGDRLIQLSETSRPILSSLAHYSGIFPCLTKGLADFQKPLEAAFGGGQPALHLTIEVVRDNGAYLKGLDEPEFEEKRGPDCGGLPNPPIPYPGGYLADGYDYGAARSPIPGLPAAHGRAVSDNLTGADMGFAGTAAERQMIDLILAPAMGRPVADVPEVATLLFGPMARGTAVKLS
jgi:phospholipid/cholesterol/gamma-HCH transport system substrate-binding protein